MIRAALIDMDGVLYDSMPRHAAAWERMCREAGLDFLPDEFYLLEGCTGAYTIDVLMQRTLGRHATPDECRDLYRRKTEIFATLPRPDVMTGAPEAMNALRAAGLTRMLVTGSGQMSVLERLTTDYPGIFDDDKRITGNDVVHGKPDPEPYLKAMERIGAAPGECIVVENAPMGVMAGHRAGAFVVAVTTGPVAPEKLREAGADLVLGSMTELAREIPAILRCND